MLHGGERVREERYIAPTLVEGDPLSGLMQEEIFAPVLPLIEVSDFEAALRFIAGRPKPLAAYLFSRNNCPPQLMSAASPAALCSTM